MAAATWAEAVNPKTTMSKQDARTPFVLRPLHGVGYADGSVNGGVESECREDFIVRVRAGAYDFRRETVESQSNEAAFVPVEASRDPPECRARANPAKTKGRRMSRST